MLFCDEELPSLQGFSIMPTPNARPSLLNMIPVRPVYGIRFASIVLGVWLFVSAFVWAHDESSRTNTMVLGVLIAIVGALSTLRSSARLVNVVAAVWLFFSTLWVFHPSQAAGWNNAIVAFLVLAVSFVPTRDEMPTLT
jgi:hypothetical protein